MRQKQHQRFQAAFTSPSYVSFPPTIRPCGTLTAPQAEKAMREKQNVNTGPQNVQPAAVPGTRLCCIVSAGTKSGPRSTGGRSAMEGRLGGGGGGGRA